jgi:hypothetical protein
MGAPGPIGIGEPGQPVSGQSCMWSKVAECNSYLLILAKKKCPSDSTVYVFMLKSPLIVEACKNKVCITLHA